MRKRKILGKIFGTTLVFVMIVVVCLGVVAAQPVAGTTEASDPPCNCGDICVNETGWWHDGGGFNASATPIQSAVDNATSGETICVKDGNYTENVDVNTANLTIQSENGTANCVVSASSSNDHVFDVSADWVNITGLTVKDATGTYKVGIHLGGVSHCNISSNNATNNSYGIWLESSSSNTLTNNTANSNTHHGIWLESSSSNTLTNNTANSNTHHGIWLCYSRNNTLTNNTASNNAYNGINLWSSSNNNTLRDNTALNNDNDGIYLYSSNNNTLTNNTASNNTEYGIYLYSSSDNTIYNNYFDNTNNAYDDGTNTWNTTNTTGPNIAGGPYLGGNYWSDYSGVDANGDGFGDTPYNITGGANKDYLPLILPPATLEGNVSFYRAAAHGNSTWETPLVVSFFDNGTGIEAGWSPKYATTDAYGNFTVDGIAVGTYDIGIKNWTCLSELNMSVTLTTGNTTVVDFGTMREGDANDDDIIGSSDYSLLSFAYDTWPAGPPNWNPNCDFNRDDYIGSTDYSLLSFYYNQWGDAYGYF